MNDTTRQLIQFHVDDLTADVAYKRDQVASLQSRLNELTASLSKDEITLSLLKDDLKLNA